MKRILFLTTILTFLLAACQQKDMLWTTPEVEEEAAARWAKSAQEHLAFLDYNYTQNVPRYLLVAEVEKPVVNHAKAALGRVLFYDKSLSRNSDVSCASCHKQMRAFADSAGFSMGTGGQLMSRQSLPLNYTVNFRQHHRSWNTEEAPRLMWDGRATSLEEVMQMAITHPREMNMTLPEVMERIRSKDFYLHLWQKAFGHAEPKASEMLEALSQFVGAMSAHRTRFDELMELHAGNPRATIDTVRHFYYGPIDIIVTPPRGFTLSEFRGMQLFSTHCSPCHSPIRRFQEVFEACNGLEVEYEDQGKGKVTGNPKDNGVFKSLPLRNIGLTAPFMHDGRFKTMAEVIDFYSTGIKPHPNLHPLLRNPNGSPKQMNFSAQNKQDLINFIKILTDFDAGGDVRFSDPFRRR